MALDTVYLKLPLSSPLDALLIGPPDAFPLIVLNQRRLEEGPYNCRKDSQTVRISETEP